MRLTVEWHINEVVDMYDQFKRQTARDRANERARERRAEKQQYK